MTAVALLAFGCGKSNENGQSSTSPAPASVNGSASQDRSAFEAKSVVTDFLNALRRGDDSKAKSLLTKVAHQKVDEQGMSLGRGASDNVKIEVDDATLPTPEHEIAHVPTRWTDQDENGKPRTDRATWVCRREPEGWRVAGFAAYVFEGEDALFMNFEDPEDMAKHQQWLNDEMERRSKAESAPRTSGESSLEAQQPKDAFRR